MICANSGGYSFVTDDLYFNEGDSDQSLEHPVESLEGVPPWTAEQMNDSAVRNRYYI